MVEEPYEHESVRRRRERLAATFEAKMYGQVVQRMKHRFADPAFWQALCPKLTVSERPFAAPSRPYPAPDGLPAECEETVALDGYFVTPPIVEPGDVSKMREATKCLAANGYPTGFVSVYDEFWRLFHSLRDLVGPLLGDDYMMVPDGLWTFLVPPGDPGISGWSSVSPHRDSIGPDPHLLATGRPGILNIWIALTEATPLNSCIYVLPASVDDEYLIKAEPPPTTVTRLADVRALPVAAGSVLGWTSHLLHWGSRSSPRASVPRVSAALYLQRGDVDPYWPDVISFDDVVPFEKRISWIARSMAMPDLFCD